MMFLVEILCFDPLGRTILLRLSIMRKRLSDPVSKSGPEIKTWEKGLSRLTSRILPAGLCLYTPLRTKTLSTPYRNHPRLCLPYSSVGWAAYSSEPAWDLLPLSGAGLGGSQVCSLLRCFPLETGETWATGRKESSLWGTSSSMTTSCRNNLECRALVHGQP